MASQEGEGKGARRRGIARHSRTRRAVVCRLLRVTPRGGPPSSPPPRAAVCAGYTGAWACRWGHAGGGAAVETPPHPRPPLVAVTWTASAQFPPPPPPTRRVVPVGVHRQGDTAGRGPPTGGHRGAVVLVAAASGRERGGGGGTVTSGQDDGRRNGGRAAVPPRTSPVCLPVRRGRAAAWPGGLGDCLAGGGAGQPTRDRPGRQSGPLGRHTALGGWIVSARVGTQRTLATRRSGRVPTDALRAWGGTGST